MEQDAVGVTLRMRSGEALRARYVVAADGLHSPTRRQLGLDRPARDRRFGLRRHYAVPAAPDTVEVWWGPRAEAYVTPVAPGVVGVALLTRTRAQYDELLAEFPALATQLPGSELADVRGAGPLRQRSAAPVAGRVLLAGDAAGYVDALTGEGLTLGWRQAAAAVDAVAHDEPGRYAREHPRIGIGARVLTDVLVRATAHPPVRRHLVQAAGIAPPLFRGAVTLTARAR